MKLSVTLSGTTALGITGAALLTALVTAPMAAATPEDNFLSVLAAEGISMPSGDPANTIEVGKAVCQDWAAGATLLQETSSISDAAGITPDQAGFFIGAATGAFCPEYESKLQ
jgi:hypothetical protein